MLGHIARSLVVENDALVFVYTALFALFATLDLYNAHTLPLYTWQLAMAVGFCMTLPAFVYQASWSFAKAGTTREDFAKLRDGQRRLKAEADAAAAAKETAKLMQELPRGGTGSRMRTGSHMQLLAQQESDTFLFERTRALGLFFLVHSGSMLAHYVALLVKAVFLYRHTANGDPGTQTLIDDLGFPTEQPMGFTLARKMDLLVAVQAASLASAGLFLAGLYLRRQYRLPKD